MTTTYCGQIRAGNEIYDVIVVDSSTNRMPCSFKVDYRKSKYGSLMGLEEASVFVHESEEFRTVPEHPWKTTILRSNGNGKGKLEGKIVNFLISSRK